MHTSAVTDHTHHITYYFQICAYKRLEQGTVMWDNSEINTNRLQVFC